MKLNSVETSDDKAKLFKSNLDFTNNHYWGRLRRVTLLNILH